MQSGAESFHGAAVSSTCPAETYTKQIVNVLKENVANCTITAIPLKLPEKL